MRNGNVKARAKGQSTYLFGEFPLPVFHLEFVLNSGAFGQWVLCYPCANLDIMPTGLIVKKIAIYVDVQNIYYTTRQAYGRQFNYRKLWQRISSEGEIVSATAYAIHRGDDKQLNFQNILKQIGFTVKLKPFIQRSDGSAKGDWDVGITIDIMDAAKGVDTVVLLSGDGDFALLLDKITKDYGVSAEVYGVPALTANSLIESATKYHPIDDDLLL